ncbi:MAG: hypothetical protein WKF41_12115 [Gaiellaceae bacterium]
MDEITVTLPRERPFGAVAGLVLGGVAARHDVTLEVLDDLQLALETLLDHEQGERELKVVLCIEAGTARVSVGPFEAAAVAELEEEAAESLDLRRLLHAVVDTVSVDERADGCWVDLDKGYALEANDGR